MRIRSLFNVLFFATLIIVSLTGCDGEKNHNTPGTTYDSATLAPAVKDIPTRKPRNVVPQITGGEIVSEVIHPDSILAFAKTLIGIPYLYASTDPQKGFDCSGFITYVFNHFGLAVPRSSVDFTNMGREIAIDKARPGDLILFTGTDSTIRIVGHMGIVENVIDGKLQFIHSTSGKAKGVVITPFENYYQGRFVKVIRIFPEKFFE